jgi:type IV secretory pathway VirB2 component (pilin)
MTQNSKGPGGCIVTILIILVTGAAFGLIEWSTVGSFVRFIVAFFLAAALAIIVFLLWAKFGGRE